VEVTASQAARQGDKEQRGDQGGRSDLPSHHFLILTSYRPANAEIHNPKIHTEEYIMKSNTLSTSHVTELLYQALETEKGGVQIYATALRCALNEDLKEEWNEYLEQTKTHVQIVSDILKSMNLDLEVETPGRKIVRHIGDSLVQAMEMALRGPDLAAAQIVAAECVTLAETKDHLNWGLIGEIAKASNGEGNALLKQAYDQVEPEEDEHLYHTTGWTRELWIEALGMPAVLPPPEEKQDVETAIEAAQAKAQAKKSRAKHA
jgi:rubrerythrin